MATYRERDVVETPQQQSTSTVSERRLTFSPGQILAGIVGVILVLFGVLAVTSSGIDSTLNTPISDVLGLGLWQSAAVGLVEVLAGLLLILSASRSEFRPLMGTVGVLLFIGGLVIAAGSAQMLIDIGTRHGTGWFAMVAGAVAVFAAVLPSFTRHDRVTRVE